MDRASVPCGSCRRCCGADVIMLLPDEGDDVASYDHQIVALPGIGSGPVVSKGADGNCIYLGRDGCTIHDRAPAICRIFDCRKLFLSHSRAERRRMIAGGMASKEVFEAGRERLASLEIDL